MKKVIPGILVALVVAVAAAYVLYKKTIGNHVAAEDLAPADTILFVQLPNLPRTALRWPQTAVAKIGAEPEVQAFLEKPRANSPQWKLWQEKLQRFAMLAPREGYLAVTSIDGATPRFVAGFAFLGRKSDAKELLADPRAEMKRAWPAGKSDITLHGKVEIETYTHQDMTVGEAFQDDWYFVSNDLELLKRTLDAGKQAGGQALSTNELYRKTVSHLPKDGEALVYAQVGVLTERLVSLLVASGQAPDPKQLAELKNIQALAWGTKFEGEQMRDTLFVLSPGKTAEPPLARNSQSLSSATTFLTYTAAIPATIEIPQSSMALGAFLPGFAAFQQALEEKGLKLNEIGQAFGPEFGFLGNWQEKAGQPSAIVALDVRDVKKARGFVDVFTGGLPGSPAWGRTEETGITLYQSPAGAGLIPITPTAALTDRFLVLGFSAPEVIASLEQLSNEKSAISSTAAYKTSIQQVGAPTSGFGYLDLKTLFDRTYTTLRPFIAMSLAFSPDAGKMVDAGKLPEAETISKHLTPSVFSQSVSEEGTLVESVGTLTFNQLFFGIAGGSIAAAFPMIENSLASGLKLDPNTFQLTPPPSASSPAPAPNPSAPSPNLTPSVKPPEPGAETPTQQPAPAPVDPTPAPESPSNLNPRPSQL